MWSFMRGIDFSINLSKELPNKPKSVTNLNETTNSSSLTKKLENVLHNFLW